MMVVDQAPGGFQCLNRFVGIFSRLQAKLCTYVIMTAPDWKAHSLVVRGWVHAKNMYKYRRDYSFEAWTRMQLISVLQQPLRLVSVWPNWQEDMHTV